jgi:hypothetical protein
MICTYNFLTESTYSIDEKVLKKHDHEYLCNSSFLLGKKHSSFLLGKKQLKVWHLLEGPSFYCFSIMMYFAIILLLYSLFFHLHGDVPVNRKLSRISTLQESIQNAQERVSKSNLGGANTIGSAKPPSDNQVDVVMNGGKIMSGSIKCHCIWYGDWTGSKGISSSPQARKIIEDFISNLGDSNWWKIVKTYGESLNIVLGNSAEVTYLSQNNGKDMSYSSGYNELIVTTAANLQNFPLDDKSVYLIFPSEDITKVNVRDYDQRISITMCEKKYLSYL